ncbi:FCD domain protein [compost metagenome]
MLVQLEYGVAKMEGLESQDATADAYTLGTRHLSRLLFSICRNERLTEILQTLSLQTARYTQIAFNDPQRCRDSVAGWRQVLEALKVNEVDQAASALENLIEESRLAAIKTLKAQPALAAQAAARSDVKESR